MTTPRHASDMKDSGIEWVGMIPKNWNKNKIRYLVQLINGYPFQSSLYSNEGFFVVRITNVDDGKLNTNNPRYYPEELVDEYKSCLLKGNDILMSLTGNVGLVGIVDESYPKSALNQRVGCIRVSSPLIMHKYLYYLLTTQDFSEAATLYSKGTVQLNMSTEWLLNERIPIPDISEQQAIANYLDDRCSKIDEIIAEATASIEEYKELRVATITECVSRGLDNNDIETRDSGDSWVGDIPCHWKLCKVKNIASYVSDGAHVSPETDNGVYSFISTVNLRDGVLDFDNCLCTSEESYRQLVKNGCQPIRDDVLISKDGSVGKTTVIDYDREFVVSSSLVIIRPRTDIINPYFLQYNLQSNFVQQRLLLLMHGAGLKRVSVAKNSNLPVVLPPVDEQIMIVEYLDRKISEIDSLILEKQALINDLQAYKKSLIYEVVTGKRRVV